MKDIKKQILKYMNTRDVESMYKLFERTDIININKGLDTAIKIVKNFRDEVPQNADGYFVDNITEALESAKGKE